MTVILQVQWLFGVILVSARLATLLFMSPLFSLGQVPARVLVLVVIVFSVGINNCIGQYENLVITHIGALLIALAHELLVGLLMAFGLHGAFAAFSFGGRVLDLQMGFGIANLVNPSTNEQSPLMGMALLAAAVMTFYLMNAHHWIIRGFVQSFEWFPLGTAPSVLPMAAVLKQFGLMFSMGMTLVAPVVIVLLLVDGAMAIAVRTMPQVNIFMLSIPVKITLGLLVLALSIPLLKNVFERIFESIFSYWGALA